MEACISRGQVKCANHKPQLSCYRGTLFQDYILKQIDRLIVLRDLKRE
ncbi:MAG: hypothetical protein LBK00_00985 [Treponema sp.]|nr:hypothetical protein [Treponema sp.]